MTKDHLQLAAGAVGLLGPAILLAGYAYYLGWTTAFGFDTSLINRGLGDVVAESWLMGMRLIVYFIERWWYPITYLALILLFLVLIILSHRKLEQRGINLFDEGVSRTQPGVKILGLSQWWWKWIGGICSDIYTSAFPWLVIFFIAMTTAALPAQLGQRDAAERLAAYEKWGCDGELEGRFERCVTLYELTEEGNKQAVKGILVAADAANLAIYHSAALEVIARSSNTRIMRLKIKTTERAIESSTPTTEAI